MTAGRNGQDPGTPRAVRAIPDATVARLPLYLQALTRLTKARVLTASSEELADAVGVNPAKLRRDLSYLGSYGTRGVGYDVEQLHEQISHEVGLCRTWAVAIVGVGNLGQALAKFEGFSGRGFTVVALFDADERLVGTSVGDQLVRHIDYLGPVVTAERVTIGVLATPPSVSQELCDRLVEAGVTSILNFAPTSLNVPDHVRVRRVDLSRELQILAYHEQQKNQSTEPMAEVLVD